MFQHLLNLSNLHIIRKFQKIKNTDIQTKISATQINYIIYIADISIFNSNRLLVFFFVEKSYMLCKSISYKICSVIWTNIFHGLTV